MFKLDSNVNMDWDLLVHLTVEGFTFFQIFCIWWDCIHKEYDFFYGLTLLCDAGDGLTEHRPTSFLAYIVEVNPLFITSDDPVQNFTLVQIFEQISGGLKHGCLYLFELAHVEPDD